MRVLLAAIGKLSAGPERELAEDYLERARGLGRKAGIAVIEVAQHTESKAGTPDLRKADEARRLLAGLPGGAVRIVLDEQGKDVSSAAFAQLLRRHIDAGTGDLAILIGGPDGHGPAVLEGAAAAVAFGRMTWPHRLVRVMLAEQIYRAVTILLNHPYHRA